MKETARKLLFFVFISVIASCASRHAPPTVNRPSPIRSIAIVSGDPLANAIGVELFNQGFKTFQLPATQDLTPKALQSLASRGVDGVLVVKSTKRGFDPLPESASLRLLRTQTGQEVTALAWRKSDQMVPKNLTDIAREVVRTLLQTVPRPPAS
jgi:hypothetical protein